MADPVAASPEYVPAVDPSTGQVTKIPASEVALAQQQGWRPPTSDEWQAYWRNQTYGQGIGRKAQAFGLGASNILPVPGIERVAGALMGLSPAEALAVREENTGAHLAGAVAPIAAHALLTAGASVPAEGAVEGAGALAGLAAKSAPGLLSRVGGAVAGATREAVGEAPGLLGRLAPGAAQGAVEGGLFAAQDVANRFALGDPKLTAQAALAEVGMGVAGGAAAAGTLGLTGEALAAALSKGEKLAKAAAIRLSPKGSDTLTLELMASAESRPAFIALDKSAPGILDELAVAKPDTAAFLAQNAERVGAFNKQHPGFLDRLARATPDEADRILNASDKLITSAQGRVDLGQMLTDRVTNTYQAVDDAVRGAGRTARSAEVNALAAKADPSAAQAQLGSVFDQLAELTNKLKAEPSLYHQGVARKVEIITEGLAQRAKAAPEEIYWELNTAKQQLDDLLHYGQDAQQHVARWTDKEVSAVRRSIKEGLEDSGTWGEAGARQGEFNRAFAEYKDASAALGAGKNKSGTLEAKILRKVSDGQGGVTYEANEKTVNTWLNLMADTRGGAKSVGFRTYLDKAEALAAQMEKSGFDGAAELQASIRATRAEFADTEAKAAVTQLVKSLEPGRESLSSGPAVPSAKDFAREAASGLSDLIPGVSTLKAVGKATAERVRSPSFMVGALDAFGDLSGRFSKSVEAGIGSIFKGTARVAGTSAAAAESASSAAARVTPKNFTGVASDIRRQSDDMEGMAERLAQNTRALREHSEPHAQEVIAAAARRAQYLAESLPKTDAVSPLGGPRTPTSTELAEFNRKLAVAERPVIVLKHLADGTLTQAHLEAGQVIYPELMQTMREQLLDRVAKAQARGETIPMKVRMGLGSFLGMDLDPGSKGSTVAATVAALHQERMANPTNGQGVPGASSLTLGNRLQTSAQAAATRTA